MGSSSGSNGIIYIKRAVVSYEYTPRRGVK